MLTKIYNCLFVPSIWEIIEQFEIIGPFHNEPIEIVYVQKNQFGKIRQVRIKV